MIDAYTHCGLSKYLPAEDVLATMEKAGINNAVLCQHLGEYDNQYLARVVELYPEKFAAICLVDPESPEARADLRKWNSSGYFRGLRVLSTTLSSNQSLCLEALDLGMNLMVYAPNGISSAITPLLNITRQQSKSRIIISHLGNPILTNGHLTREQEIFQLASEPGIFVQLSGLSMFCDYPYTALTKFIQEIIKQFTAERILWGSNFPVCGNERAYIRDLNMILSRAWKLDPIQVEWITARTAKETWFDT